MRVLMVDDHVMFLQGLKNLLSVLAPALVVDIADSAERALQLAPQGDYGLVLLDWDLGEVDGASVIARLRQAGCTAQVVVLSGQGLTQPLIQTTIEAGAAGFIPKQFSSQAMLSALDVVLAGGIYLPAQAFRSVSPAQGQASRVVDLRERFAELTPRQVEVYRAVTRGLPNKLIARQLGIAESTVKTHLTAVYAVLGVTNRTQAAYQACVEGFRVGE